MANYSFILAGKNDSRFPSNIFKVFADWLNTNIILGAKEKTGLESDNIPEFQQPKKKYLDGTITKRQFFDELYEIIKNFYTQKKPFLF